MVGETVGPYQVIARLGAGGMGEVFLGHDPRLQRRVALKCLSRSDTQSDEAHERILREARAAARLNHTNIAAIYDVIQENSRTFIVMEYVEGESLAIRIGRGRLPIDEVRRIGRQLAAALAAAHAEGVVHRDLKPANVHVTRDGSIKVLDFGVAKLAPRTGLSTGADTGSAIVEDTLPGSPGTPIYMSPEQLFNREVDARSDIYSAGVILFEALTGRRPYPETGAVNLAVAMTSAAAPAASSINPDVPADLDAAVARALERDPAQRFSSAGAFADALTATNASTTIVSNAAGPRWPAGPLIAAGAVAVVVAGFFLLKPLITGADRSNGAAAGQLVLALLPFENPSRNVQSEYLGAGISSLIARNFGSIPGVTVISKEATARYRQPRDLARLRRELGANYVVDVTVTAPPPQAEIQARLRRVATGETAWEETLSGDPLAVEHALLDRLTSAFERAGAWPAPLTDADRVRLKKGPTTSAVAFASYSEARALLDRRADPANVTRAVELLEKALQLDPAFQLASAALGDAYLEQYRVQKDPALAARANEAVNRALRASSGDADPWIYYALGNIQWSTGRYQDAMVSLRRSLELQPDNDETHTLLARVLADRGEIDAAVGELQTAIRIRPDFWRTYMVLGNVTYRAGRLNDSLDAYKRAAELQPDDPGPFSGMGLIHQVRGDLSQAIGNYQHAVQLGASATAYSNLGLVYYTTGRFDEAVQAWKQALTIEPKNALYHRNVGDAYRRLRQPGLAAAAYDQAIAAAEAMLAINPRDVDAISMIAVCAAKRGRRGVAERRAAEAVALAPSNRLALQRSAEVHALLGDKETALRDLKKAIDGGYSRSTARSNDEFESLRGLPEFQALTAEPPANGKR